MKGASLLLFAVVLATAAAGQVTNPLPICFSFNDTSPPGVGFQNSYVRYGGTLWVHFTAPVSAVVDVLEIWGNLGCTFCQQQYVNVDIHQTPALGTIPTTPSLGHFSGAFAGYPGWFSFPTVTTPAALSAGATYALLLSGWVSGGITQIQNLCIPVPYDPVGPTQLPYQFTASQSCPGSLPPFPPSGTIGLMIRFRGAACGPGPPANVAVLGNGCGLAAGSSPYSTLASATPPTLGGSFTFSITGPANEACYVFWSGGVNPGGSLIAPGASPCLHYLDPVSLMTLASQGAEPIAAATIPPSAFNPAIGTVTWTFPVTANPFYAGLVVGIQALIVGPSGAIPLGGGLSARSTTALQLTLGY